MENALNEWIDPKIELPIDNWPETLVLTTNGFRTYISYHSDGKWYYENHERNYNVVGWRYQPKCDHLEIPDCPMFEEEQPYITTRRAYDFREYNPKFGDDRMCECGHVYYRHFDSWEDMDPCGCKYCCCDTFKEATELKN